MKATSTSPRGEGFPYGDVTTIFQYLTAGLIPSTQVAYQRWRVLRVKKE